jgi:hypothetical protein
MVEVMPGNVRQSTNCKYLSMAVGWIWQMDRLFRHFPCMKFATRFFFSSFGENLHKFAQFALEFFSKC